MTAYGVLGSCGEGEEGKGRRGRGNVVNNFIGVAEGEKCREV